MATWGTSGDVLADLDFLSEISAGDECNDLVVYNTYGRGQPVTRVESFSDVRPGCYMDQFSLLQDAGPVGGRGQMLKLKQECLQWEKEKQLRNQLRQACGVGYSNTLIEQHWGNGTFDSDSEKLVTDDHLNNIEETEQFEDLPDPDSHELPPSSKSSPQPISPAHKPVNCGGVTVVSDKSDKTMESKFRRRVKRNALLSGLAASKSKESIPPLIQEETADVTQSSGTHSFVGNHSTRSTVASSPHGTSPKPLVKVARKCSPSSHQAFSSVLTHSGARAVENRFALKSEDFPPLNGKRNS